MLKGKVEWDVVGEGTQSRNGWGWFDVSLL